MSFDWCHCTQPDCPLSHEKAAPAPVNILLLKVCESVFREAERAAVMFPPMASPHEALGIIQEEFAEYAAEVYRFNLRKERDSRPEMRDELMQLAATCVRAIVDLGL